MDAAFHHELVTWRPVRYAGVAASFGAFTLSLVSVCNRHWVSENGFHVGVWDVCYIKPNTSDHAASETCLDSKPNWQNAVIGLLIFSVGFGFLATVLSICGVCTLTLPKKIYYYHSAGEIYFICALSSMAALIVYPTAIQAERRVAHYQFGAGYGLGWAAAVLYFTSAMCMCLDDLVRTLARGLCRCCSGRDTDSRV